MFLIKPFFLKNLWKWIFVLFLQTTHVLLNVTCFLVHFYKIRDHVLCVKILLLKFRVVWSKTVYEKVCMIKIGFLVSWWVVLIIEAGANKDWFKKWLLHVLRFKWNQVKTNVFVGLSVINLYKCIYIRYWYGTIFDLHSPIIDAIF